MDKKFFLLTFLLLASSVFSLSISSPSEVPVGSPFSAEINFSLDSKEELRLYLDDSLLITLFEFNSTVFVDSPKVSPRIVDYSFSNTKLVVSVSGMDDSVGELKARIVLNDSILEEEVKNIDFYSPFSWKEKKDLEAKIMVLEQTAYNQRNLINSLESDLNAKNSQLSKLNEKIESISNQIRVLNENDEDKTLIISKINSDLNEILNPTPPENPLTGLFSFGPTLSTLGVILLILGVILAGILIIQKKKRDEAIL